MKFYLTILSAVVIFGLIPNLVSAQQNKEAEIQDLEKMEGQAWVEKDSITLFKYIGIAND